MASNARSDDESMRNHRRGGATKRARPFRPQPFGLRVLRPTSSSLVVSDVTRIASSSLLDFGHNTLSDKP